MSDKLNIINWENANIITSEQIGLLPGDNRPKKSYENAFWYVAYGRDLPAHEIKIPYQWNSNPFDDRNWFAQLHMMRMLDSNILNYEHTKDASYMEFPCDIFIDWLNFYKNTFSEDIPALVWSDMIVGIRSLRLSYCISFLVNIAKLETTIVDRMAYEELVLQHLKFLLNKDNYKFNNHSIHDIHGLMGLAQIVNTEWKQKINQFVEANMQPIILSQFNEQGMHLENSPEYHNYGMRLFQKLNETGWFLEFNLKKFLKKAETFTSWFILPDGRLLPFGDTTRKKAPRRTVAVEHTNDTNILNNSGYVVIKSTQEREIKNSSYLAFMGACNSKTHKQSDDMSLFWFEGEEILSDMGKYAYQNCIYRKHALSTRAHNTVEINGDDYYRGTSISKDQIFGSAVKSVEIVDFGYHIKSAVHRTQLAQTKNLNLLHTRDVLYCMGRFLIVLDRITSQDSLKFINWLNFSPDIDLVKNIVQIENKYEYALKLKKTNRKLFVNGEVLIGSNCNIIQGKGVETPRTIGWSSDKYNTVLPSLAIGVESVGKECSFVTVFSLDSSLINVDVNLNSGLLSIKDLLTSNSYLVNI